MRLFKQTSVSNSIDYTSTVVIEDTTRWIIASRNEWLFAVGTNQLEVSLDNGVTYPNTIAFADAELIRTGYIFRNGNIIFETSDNKIYLTDYNLGSVTEKTVYDTNGINTYKKHTPVNPIYPGAYYNVVDYMESTDDTDVYIFTNYSNAHTLGASPTNIYETRDFGETIKVSYKFGQNLNHRDDGSATGSNTGTLLGDSANSIVAKHGHSVGYNPNNGKYYVNTGDANVVFNSMDEIHWLEGVDNGTSIDWTVLNFGSSIERTSRLKAVGFFFVDDYIYWVSDANPVTNDTQQGLWRSKLSTFTTTSTHERIIALTQYESALSIKVDWNTNRILINIADNSTGFYNKLLAAEDFGHGTVSTKTYDSSYYFYRINSPNAFGFFRLDVGWDSINQGRSYLIKVGDDLLENL